MGSFRLSPVMWNVLAGLIVAYLTYTILDTAEKVKSTNDYVKSLDSALTRWMAEPRDTQTLSRP